jgi:hypothetical protein
MKAYAVLTGRIRYDLELQIVVHSVDQAKREVKDLKKMGLDDARWKEFEDEAALDAWYEAKR